MATDVTDALAALPLLPRDADGPVFSEPWNAQAFAVVVQLIESGVITRNEWAESLANTLKDAELRGETDTGERYYDHWLDALEALVVNKNLAAGGDLLRERELIQEHDHHRREDQLHHDH